jgi:hypothetical protein
MAVDTAKLAGVMWFEDLKHFFEESLPAYLKWLGENWGNLFKDMASITERTFTNMWGNAKRFFENLWKYLKGQEGDWKWTGLTEGFKSSLTELPKIAARQQTGLEKELADKIAKNAGGFQEKFQQNLAANKRELIPANPENTKMLGDFVKAAQDWVKRVDVKGGLTELGKQGAIAEGTLGNTLNEFIGEAFARGVLGKGEKKEEFKSTTEDLSSLYKRISGAAGNTPELEAAKKTENNTAKQVPLLEKAVANTAGLLSVFKTGAGFVAGFGK